MKNIRNSVFETNSSSSHSIHIDRDTKLRDTSLIPNEDGVITILGQEFGWEWVRYNDAVTKAAYASIETSGVNRDVLIQAITEQTGAKEVEFRISDDWNDEGYGYIDHQSSGTLGQLGNDVEEVKNWIFNPNCWLVTGYDNGDEPLGMSDFPTIDEQGTEHPFEHTHEIRFPGANGLLSRGLKIGKTTRGDNLIEKIDRFCHENGVKFGDDEFRFDTWSVERKDLIDEENQTIAVFGSDILAYNVNKAFQKFKEELFSKKVLTEVDDPEETGEINEWREKSKIREKLLDNNKDKYIRKVKYELVEL